MADIATKKVKAIVEITFAAYSAAKAADEKAVVSAFSAPEVKAMADDWTKNTVTHLMQAKAAILAVKTAGDVDDMTAFDAVIAAEEKHIASSPYLSMQIAAVAVHAAARLDMTFEGVGAAVCKAVATATRGFVSDARANAYATVKEAFAPAGGAGAPAGGAGAPGM